MPWRCRGRGDGARTSLSPRQMALAASFQTGFLPPSCFSLNCLYRCSRCYIVYRLWSLIDSFEMSMSSWSLIKSNHGSWFRHVVVIFDARPGCVLVLGWWCFESRLFSPLISSSSGFLSVHWIRGSLSPFSSSSSSFINRFKMPFNMAIWPFRFLGWPSFLELTASSNSPWRRALWNVMIKWIGTTRMTTTFKIRLIGSRYHNITCAWIVRCVQVLLAYVTMDPRDLLPVMLHHRLWSGLLSQTTRVCQQAICSISIKVSIVSVFQENNYGPFSKEWET